MKHGKYKHYKEKYYEVVGECVHSETLEELILYKALYDSENYPYGSLWVRPKKMFLEKVSVDGEEVPRFKFVGDE